MEIKPYIPEQTMGKDEIERDIKNILKQMKMETQNTKLID